MRWSLTIPTACMWPYITVDPTKLNPRRFRSRLKASDSRVVDEVDADHRSLALHGACGEALS